MRPRTNDLCHWLSDRPRASSAPASAASDNRLSTSHRISPQLDVTRGLFLCCCCYCQTVAITFFNCLCFKMKQAASPYCTLCGVREDLNPVLCERMRYRATRTSLLVSLGLLLSRGLTLNDVFGPLSSFKRGYRVTKALLSFLRSTEMEQTL